MIRIGASQVYHGRLVAGLNDVPELSETHDAVSTAKTEVLHPILTHCLPLYVSEIDRFRHTSRSDGFVAFLDRFPTPVSITALAQSALPFAGFAPLPAFAWSRPRGDEAGRWSGSYAAVSTGYAFSTSKASGSHGGPTLGLGGGRMWQDGRFVYGIVGGVGWLIPGSGSSTLGAGGFGYAGDLSGAVQVQVGTLLSDDVLLYGKAGAWAVHERLRFGGTPTAPLYDRDQIAVRPDARVEWAITDRLSVAVEAGIVGNRLH